MGIQRVTTPLLLVAQELISAASEEHYGYRVARATGLSGATVQQILTRLEDAGWLDARWEDIDPRKEGRRPRRLYAVNGAGVRALSSLVYEHRQRLSKLTNLKPGGAWA